MLISSHCASVSTDLRILGWVVMVTALAIPSTPTLGLPLVALLVFALAPIPEQVAGDGLAS